MTPQLAGIGRAELGPHAGVLAEERQTILAAIDRVGRSWAREPHSACSPIRLPHDSVPASAGPGSLAHDAAGASADLNAASARRFISSGSTSSTCVEIVQM